MKTFFKKCYFLIHLISFLFSPNLFTQTFTPVDFEAAGYVTEVYLKPYFNSFNLYARTDIGGVYTTSYIYDIEQSRWEWGDWTPLNSFAKSPASMHIQGFDAYGSKFVACGTDYLINDPGRGLWRQDVYGNWSKVLDINYGGNVFHSKVGGECVLIEYPDIGDFNIVYTGGREITGNRSTIYRSDNDGVNWVDINPASGSFVTGNVSSIILNRTDLNNIWVGTDRGLWFGDRNSNGTFTWHQVKSAAPPGDNYDYVKLYQRGPRSTLLYSYGTPIHRIVMTPDGTKIFLSQGEQIWRGDIYYTREGRQVSWTDLTPAFDGYTPTGDGTNLISAVTLFPNPFSPIMGLVVSRIDVPTKISYDYGQTWSAEIDCPVDPNSLPKHKCSAWDYHISYSRTNFTYTGFGWFSSGPFNLYRSQTTDFTGNWEFMGVDNENYTQGINFPVVYDITFGQSSNPYMYIGVSDVVQARFGKNASSNGTPNRYHIIDYAREKIPGGCDAYMSNANRILNSPANSSAVFMVGGNLYSGWQYSFVRSTDYGDNFSIPTTNLPMYGCIIDALISDSDPNEMLVLLGGNDNALPIESSLPRGLFRTTNALSSPVNFQPCSQFPLVGSYVGEAFSHQKNLEKDPVSVSIKYLYLQQNPFDNNTGGFFKSTDYGVTWNFVTRSFPGIGFLDEGCLVSTTYNGSTVLLLAIRNQGLFRSFNNGSNWEKLSFWTSASQVAAKDNIVYVFGDPSTDPEVFNKIFRSDNHGTTFPNELTNSQYKLPTVTHLTIDPSNSNKLWISTTGQGVYSFVSSNNEDGDRVIKHELAPFEFSLNQNYPNPFNPKTTINYSVAHGTNIEISVYDLTGKEVSILVNEYKEAGYYKLEFDGSNFASGLYFYKMKTENYSEVKKMVLIK